MTLYVYHWDLRPRPDIRIELEIEASSVVAARRELLAFLDRHAGASWPIEAVSRGRPMRPPGRVVLEATPPRRGS